MEINNHSSSAATLSAYNYQLSTELATPHTGAIQALAVVNENVVIVGSNDNLVSLWKRLPNGRQFGSMHVCCEHTGMLRAIEVVPAGVSPLLPMGGFATGALDSKVRVYSLNLDTEEVSLILSLDGHTGGVDSLSMSSDGHLLSAARDGTARIWDLNTGKCIQVLGEHENATKVLGLRNGNIATGSAGRRDENNRHVDYKIRIFARSQSSSASTASNPNWALQSVLEDHDQAIQDLSLFPGVGFISCSNDGTIKLRSEDGAVLETFSCGKADDEGNPVSVFRVSLLPNSLIAACYEDNTVRLFDPDGGVHEIPLPGTPWGVSGFENGDFIVVSTQAGMGSKGHAYVFTMSSDRLANETERAQFAKDMEPPKRSAPTEEGEPELPHGYSILGSYSERHTIPSTGDPYGFFRMDSGGIMVCSWDAATGAWQDIGEIEGDKKKSTSSSEKYDFVRNVSLDTSRPGGGLLELRWNHGDDPVEVAKQFIQQYKLPEDNYEEIRDFVLSESSKVSRPRGSTTSGTNVTTLLHSMKQLPSKRFIESTQIAWDKVWERFEQTNNGGDVPSDLTASAEELESVRSVVDTLADTTRYHSSKISRRGVNVLVKKLLHWPLNSLLPVVDILRILLSHPDGVQAYSECAGNEAFSLIRNISVKAGSSVADRGPVLLACRTLMNAIAQSNGRALFGSYFGQIVSLSNSVYAIHSHTTVRLAAAMLFQNLARWVYQEYSIQASERASTTPSVAVSGSNLPSDAWNILLDGMVSHLSTSMNSSPVDIIALRNYLFGIGTLLYSQLMLNSSYSPNAGSKLSEVNPMISKAQDVVRNFGGPDVSEDVQLTNEIQRLLCV